ncbi:hypothetical protein VPHD292_0090 [Vibrio phage D292]
MNHLTFSKNTMIIKTAGGAEVVSLDAKPDGTVHILEECDQYYSADLNQEELKALIAWLQGHVV